MDQHYKYRIVENGIKYGCQMIPFNYTVQKKKFWFFWVTIKANGKPIKFDYFEEASNYLEYLIKGKIK